MGFWYLDLQQDTTSKPIDCPCTDLHFRETENYVQIC